MGRNRNVTNLDLAQLVERYRRGLSMVNTLEGRQLTVAVDTLISLSKQIRQQAPQFDFPALWRELGIPPIPDTPPPRRLFDDWKRKQQKSQAGRPR